VREAVLSPDARLAVTVGEDGGVVWDARAGRALRRLRGGADRLESVDFSPDGRRIVSTGDRTLGLWDTATGRPLRTVRAPDAAQASFSPGGESILTWGANTRLWDARTLRLRATLSDTDLEPVFSRDGRFVLTASVDLVTVRDASSGLAVARFRVPDGVNGAGFSADATLVVAGNHLGATYVFACDVCRPVDELVALATRRLPRDLTADERVRYLHD
jgi:WD40 repeat protein